MTGDPFGEALADFHFERPAETLIIEVDSGVASPAMPPAWFFQAEDEWYPWERETLEQVDGPVLDLGCGAGRASLFLETRGVEVTAIDHSPGAVAVCRDRGIQDVRLADLIDPPTDKRWRTVLLLCGNLGLGGDWEESRRLMMRLADITTDDAVLIGDTVDPSVDQAPDSAFIRYQEAQVARGRYRGLVSLRLRYGTTVGDFWAQSNFLIEDIPALIEDTPWRLLDHHIDGVDHYVKFAKSARVPRTQ